MISELPSLSPLEALNAVNQTDSGFAFIDVRSEGEFKQGHLARFKNIPILTNDERHIVGLTYKQLGQQTAIQKGHELVDPIRKIRIENWNNEIEKSSKKVGLITCWRGGLRSKLASQWLSEGPNEVPPPTLRVRDGYKGMRKLLLETFQDERLPKLIVLTGWTGSGKTTLLNELTIPKIDLEGLACHKGSSFGRHFNQAQPTQATFENELGLHLLKKDPLILLEDESRAIGSVFLPKSLKEKMYVSEVVFLQETPIERAPHLFKEYVLDPLGHGQSNRSLFDWLSAALLRIREKLGGLKTQEIQKMLEEAFQNEIPQIELHQKWIIALLEDYYDPLYTYSLEKRPRNFAFKGSRKEVRQWILNRFDSHKL